MQIKETELNLFDSVESLIEKIQSQPVDSDVQVFILKINNKTMQTSEKSYDLKIWGKSILEWTKSAFGSCPITEIEADINSNIQSLVVPHLLNKKWTAIFYADTPLFSRKTFLNILDYAQTKCLNALKLARGYVFNTEFLKTAKNFLDITKTDLFADEFFAIFNMTQLQEASQILKKRILNHHKQNGVQILDDNSTFVDADVTIENDVVLFPNTVIQGNSVIQSGTIVEPFCTIKNSVIGKNCKLRSNHITNTTLKDGTDAKPFCVFEGENKWN